MMKFILPFLTAFLLMPLGCSQEEQVVEPASLSKDQDFQNLVIVNERMILAIYKYGLTLPEENRKEELSKLDIILKSGSEADKQKVLQQIGFNEFNYLNSLTSKINNQYKSLPASEISNAVEEIRVSRINSKSATCDEKFLQNASLCVGSVVVMGLLTGGWGAVAQGIICTADVIKDDLQCVENKKQ